jgi:RimJ/RimL family protein N-acetyltransferase
MGRDGMIAGMPIVEVVTERLALSVPATADVPDLHELYTHPRVWRDDPVSRHFSGDQTERMVERWQAAWERVGFGFWVARSTLPNSTGQLVGIGGCSLRYGLAWNLGYRLFPQFWRQGYAQEIIAEAFDTANHLHPELPMTAYLVERNVRSRRAAERAGLHQVWRGPDAGNPDPDAVRLLFADRTLPAKVVERLTAE